MFSVVEQITPIQKEVVEKLQKRGFRWISKIAGSDPGTVAVMLSKRVRFSTYHAAVEHDGSVNGEPLSGFLTWLGAAGR